MTFFPNTAYEQGLTAEQQYHQELAASQPHFASPAQRHAYEQALVEQARAGDQQAQHELLLSCQSCVDLFAARYASYIRALTSTHRIEYLDLVETANLAMLEKLAHALSTASPIAYLLATAYGTIRSYCWRYESLILTPNSCRQDHEHPRRVDSLDRPAFLDADETWSDLLPAPASEPQKEEEDYTPLYQAIEALPPQQREVTVRLFGLCGHEPSTFQQAQDALQYQSRGAITSTRRRALDALYIALLPVYPQYFQAAMSQPAASPKPEVCLKDADRCRLEAAQTALQGRGEPLTSRALAAEARISTHTARAYLHQLKGVKRGEKQTLDALGQQQRLDQAYATLQASGQAFSIVHLAKEARVDPYTARKFLVCKWYGPSAPTGEGGEPPQEQGQHTQQVLRQTFAAMLAAGEKVASITQASMLKTNDRSDAPRGEALA